MGSVLGKFSSKVEGFGNDILLQLVKRACALFTWECRELCLQLFRKKFRHEALANK